MAAGEKKPGKKNPGAPGEKHTLRDAAEEQLALIPKRSADLKGQTPEQLVHELQVHQIELETQAEELRRAHLALEESRDKFIDLYEFAPLGYLTLTDKALIAEVNLTGATLLGAERSRLLKARFRKFIAAEDLDSWDRYFVNVLNRGEKQICTLTLKRHDGSVFPARLEGGRITGSGGIITARIALSDISDIWQIGALRESEERYHSLFDSFIDAILLTAPDGRILAVNASTCRMFERTEEEIRQIGRSGILDTSDPRLALALEERNRTGRLHNYELTCIRKSGQKFPAEITSAVFNDKDGNARTNMIIRDITDRKRAEDLIQISETRYRRLFESAQDGILILNRETGRVTDSNPYIEILTGYSKEELIGKPLWDIGFIRDQAASKLAFEELQKKEYIRYEDLPLETKDGKKIEVEFVSNVYSIDPHVSVILCSIRDITDRKRAEDLIQVSETRYRRLFESAQDGILILNRETGRVTDSNPYIEILTGYSKEELIGKPLWDIGFIRDQAASKLAFEELQKKEYIRYEDLPLETKDGKKIEVEFVSNVYSIDPHVSVIQCSIRDITDRRLVEDALALASKKLNLLSSITRHDINNQMTILLGYLTLLQKKQPDPASAEYFSKLSTAAERISSMIRFTKEYDSIGAKASAWQDCRMLVDTAAKQAPLGKVGVQNDLPAGTEVFADPLVIKVFYNLMDNAARYGGRITTIRFLAEDHAGAGDQILVCEDDGDGVAAVEKDLIFERGFGKNTGLGLALSREILSITGITIKETGEPGKGARFEMTVPEGAWRTSGKRD